MVMIKPYFSKNVDWQKIKNQRRKITNYGILDYNVFKGAYRIFKKLDTLCVNMVKFGYFFSERTKKKCIQEPIFW